ncbi:helix-turn-helix transcriptional regulator [Rhodovibrio salinarum]|nr:helix-turn-helix transcriptional regulator [Rhodovibrio salinarum]
MALIENLPISVILLNRDLEVLHTNLFAGSYLTSQDTLTVKAGHLVCKNPENTQMISRAVERACDADTPSGGAVVTSLLDPRSLNRVILKIVTINEYWLASTDTGPNEQVVAMMVEFGQISETGAKGLIDTFDLSPAEFDILKKLASGLVPKQIAYERGSELWTVRTHIRNIKAKMDCRTDNELIILFNRFARF